VPLRLIVGLGFIEHGYAKLARGADGFISILHAIGTPFADLLGWATIIVEIVGGSMILLGALVPVAAVPMTMVLLVAIFTVHLPNGFSSIKLLSYDAMGAHFGQPGYETDLLYIAALVALCVGGAGPLSLDGLLSRKVRGSRTHDSCLSTHRRRRIARPGRVSQGHARGLPRPFGDYRSEDSRRGRLRVQLLDSST